ncbi:PHP domain-containing protein [Sansalvadorimonas sp. 2012CJ34-2]|uniref:PHP domain-containing protein n=1 Tax=Parendozoicomonas callyspongiae TaxID=2942213 RepID=A0ABT0PHT6_9GAMM|nr:PHP domain-containing protein [Sansalvadorimonas sp. 2012CJ34-2]MCL6270930.1 PHP domain-containing protein [Sansalvadorimonas sp. 2012CJ34-2]
MPQIVDFHCHSTASDGALSPRELLERAIEQGVESLALTDHDTVAGVRWLQNYGIPESIRLIPGCEFSTLWGNQEIHIVALNIDLENPDALAFLDNQKKARRQRSERIAEKLAQRLTDFTAEECFEGALGQAKEAQKKAGEEFVLDDEDIQVGSPHFAEWLITKGIVSSFDMAFKKYLGAKRIGNAKQFWPHLKEAVPAILSWGAVPVLAHPGRYRMSGMKMKALIKDFSEAGGLAMEVLGCQQPWGEREKLAALCNEYGLCASQGSDFHGPWSPYVELGRLGELPAGCRSVLALL